MAQDIPTPNGGVNPLPDLASDVHAWDMSIDQTWCGRRWELPRNNLRWTEVLTKHAYSTMASSPNGFATQLEVRCGGVLLVVAQPLPFSISALSSFAFLDQVSRPLNSDWSTIGLEAFHLKSGSKWWVL